MNSLKWFFSHLNKQCPPRKLGKFKYLKKLNGNKISLYDIFRITGIRDKNKYLLNEVEEKTKQKMIKFEMEKYERELKKKGTLPPRPDTLFTKEYWFRRFKKRIKLKEEEFEPLMFLTMVNPSGVNNVPGFNPGLNSENLKDKKVIASRKA